MTERPPWFKCYPERLLGACMAMPPSAGYLYIVALLRIYDVGGPILDDVACLSRRTGMQPHTVRKALAYLVDKHKLCLLDDGRIDSPTTHEQITERNSRILSRQASANSRWAKTKGKQQRVDANALHVQLDLDLDKERKKKIPKKKVPNSVLEILMVGGGLTEQTAKDVLEYRKAKKVVCTPRAIQMLAKQLFDWGDAEAAAAAMIRKNWTGCEHKWLENLGMKRPVNGHPHPIGAASTIWISSEDPLWPKYESEYRRTHEGRPCPKDAKGGWHFPKALS